MDVTPYDLGPLDGEVYHLWAAGAPESRDRFNTLMRERINTHDEAGCLTLCAAVTAAGGGDDPLLTFWSGMIHRELTRDWGEAEICFHGVLNHPDVVPNLRARAMRELGLVAQYQGRFQEARDLLTKSRDQAETDGNALFLANTLDYLGIVCSEGWVNGDPDFPISVLDQAVAYHQRSIHIFQELYRPDVELRAWNNLGAAYKNLGRYDDALTSYHTALRLAMAPSSPTPKLEDRVLHWQESRDQHLLSHNILAIYRDALQRTLPQDRYTIPALINNIAEIYEKQEHWDEALQIYQLVLATWRVVGGDYEIADVLSNLGRVYEQRGQTDAARASYRDAVAAIESTRARLKAEEARGGFLGTRLAPYERLIALTLAQPHGLAEAFEMVARVKARAFVEMVAGQSLRLPQAVPPNLLKRERDVRAALAHLYDMGIYASSSDPDAVQTIKLESDLEDVYRQMRRLDAQYAACRTVEPLSLSDAQQRLPAGAAILEYFGTSEELGCFVITPETVSAHMLPGALACVLETWQQALDRHETAFPFGLPGDSPHTLATGHAASGNATADISAILHRSLVAPIEDLIDGYEQLYIIPHGLLHYLPLHALAPNSSAIPSAGLLQDHLIMYAPSASLLFRAAPEGSTGAAVPEIDEQLTPTMKTGGLVLGYNGGDLHYAEIETRSVAERLNGIAYVGDQATAHALLMAGPNYRTVHLACHGIFNSHPQASLASGLLLADGKLSARTILEQLHLHADLVVLSACDTGQTRVQRGDEQMGLTRALLYAGAQTVLVTLWSVDDLATALLMDEFYRVRAEMPEGPSGTAKALHHAQLTLRTLSLEGAIAACLRLAAAARLDTDPIVSQNTSINKGWIDAALARLHATVGDKQNADTYRTRALHALTASVPREDLETHLPLDRSIDVQNGIDSSEWEQRRKMHPYAHPYYWAAFTLVCGGR